MVRRIAAEVNAALACVTLVASFMRFKVPMAMFIEERALSCAFCPWDFSDIATRKRCGGCRL